MSNQPAGELHCPTCGTALQRDGNAYRCAHHGLWYSYGAHLLVRGSTGEHKLRDRFTMPWEAPADANERGA